MSGLPRAGQRFGPFTVIEVLGRGGMGVTCSASQPHLNRVVALKVLDPRLADSEEYRERFAHEAATLSRLDSPHIIQVYDYGEHEGCLFLATQLVRGGDLSRRIKSTGALSVADALTLCSQLAEALVDAHRAGIVHRDIKPANVLLRDGDSPYAYLCDFGIAQSVGTGSTSTGTVIGTWAYLAPERCQGAPATPASDFYALGCVLWAMLSGTAPYTGTDVAVALAHVNEPLPQLDADSPLAVAVNELLARAMDKQPERRYSSAEEMRNAIDRVRAALAQGTLSASASAPVEATVLRPAIARPADATVLRPRDTTPETQLRAAFVQSGQPGQPGPSGRVAAVVPPPRAREGNRHGLIALAVGLAMLLVVVLGAGAIALLRDRAPASGTPGGGRSSTGSTGSTGSAESSAGKRAVPAVDYDGDRRSDVMVQTLKTGEAIGLLSGAGGFTTSAPWASGLGANGEPHRVNGDVDRDGRTDMITLEIVGGTYEVRVWRSTGGDFETGRQWAAVPTSDTDPRHVNLVTGDYDRDGRSDLALVRFATLGPRVEVLRSNGHAFDPPKVWIDRLGVRYDQRSPVLSGDFNGDDRSDLVYVESFEGGLRAQVALSTGTKFTDPAQWGVVPGGSYDQSKLAVGDFDDDGLADLTVLVPTTGDKTLPGFQLLMLRSNRTLFARPRSWGEVADWKLSESWVSAGDFDADGRTDIARLGAGQDAVELWTLASEGSKFADPVGAGQVFGETFGEVRTLHTAG